MQRVQAASVDAPATLVVQSNGAIVAAGVSATGVAPPSIFNGNSTGFGLMRFQSNGSIDTTFGTRGGIIPGFPNFNFGGVATIALQINGDVVAAGQAGFSSPNQNQVSSSFALARYFSSGQLDNTFGRRTRYTQFQDYEQRVHRCHGNPDRRQNCGRRPNRRC